MDSGPLKILTKQVWVRVGNRNNFTVPGFFKIFSCIFVFFGQEINSESGIFVPKSMFLSPKRIFLVAKQDEWPGARQGELEVRNKTKPFQREEMHPKTLFKNFENEF